MAFQFASLEDCLPFNISGPIHFLLPLLLISVHLFSLFLNSALKIFKKMEKLTDVEFLKVSGYQTWRGYISSTNFGLQVNISSASGLILTAKETVTSMKRGIVILSR